MSLTPEPLDDTAQADTLQHCLDRYRKLEQSQPNHPASHNPHLSQPASNTPLDRSSLISDVISSIQLALSLQTTLTLLAAQHSKQSRLLTRVLADNQRLRRENDVCIDQLFLHSIPIEGVQADVKQTMDKRRKNRGQRRRTATDRTTFLSGFESTDEDNEDDEGDADEADSTDDNTSLTRSSNSECPSRADGQESRSDVDLPNEAAVSTSSTPLPQFDLLVQSLANHPSIQQINNHLHHLSTLLTVQAPLSLSLPSTSSSPSPMPAATSDFDRTGSSMESSAVFGRSTELEAVMEVRVQLQRERSRRSRRITAHLRQLLLHQSAEMTAMRTELDLLRSAAYDSHASSTARDTLLLHEWMATIAGRPASNVRASAAKDTPAREAGANVDVSEVCDVQQVCGLLDGVMRHVHDSGVRSQLYVEDVKRLCVQHIIDTSARQP